jgi:hypothetical protein
MRKLMVAGGGAPGHATLIRIRHIMEYYLGP